MHSFEVVRTTPRFDSVAMCYAFNLFDLTQAFCFRFVNILIHCSIIVMARMLSGSTSRMQWRTSRNG